jgi:putative CocE/NonD family hydrolase
MQIRKLAIPVRDGCRLLTDVYAVSEGSPRPTLLHRTMYGREVQQAGGSLSVARLVDAGFNVVVQDLRGRNGSDGEFIPFRDESADTADIVRWIRAQDWASPQIGMIGRSYAGLTQWQSATAKTEELVVDAIAPEACSADLNSEWMYSGGIHRSGFALEWTLSDLLPPCGASELVDRARAHLQRMLIDPQARLEDEPAVNSTAPYLASWRENSTPTACWQTGNPVSRWDNLHVPALCINGWHDPFLAATLRDYRNITNAVGAPIAKALVIGPWRHSGPRHFGTNDDLTDLHIAWFRRQLLGFSDPSPQMMPVQLYVMGAETWLRLPEWPTDTKWVLLFLHGDGRKEGHLLADPPRGDELLGELFADWRLPSKRPPAPHGYLQAHPEAIHDTDPDVDGHVLRFVSREFDRPRILLGQIRVAVWVSTEESSFDLSVRVVRFSCNGSSSIVVDAIRRFTLDTRKPTRLEFAVGATAQYLDIADRLCLEISGSNFPEFDLNRSSADPAQARLWMYNLASGHSHISLPCYARNHESKVLQCDHCTDSFAARLI